MARLGDLCDILNGYAFKSEQYVDSGIRIIRIANVQKGYIEDSAPVFYPIVSTEYKKYELFEGDLLLSLTGNVGRVALLQKEFLPAALNQRVACLRIKDESVLKKAFLFSVLDSDYFENKCIESSKGVAQKNMSTEWLKEYNIPLFSMEEQLRISNEIDTINNLISLRKQQLSKLDELVKSRFIELFGDPEANPNRWSISKLSEFCDLQNGYAFKSDDYLTNSAVLNCRMSNIRPDGGFDADYHPKYLPDMFWEKYKDYRLVDGDVIIAMTDMASDPKILGVPTIVRTNGKKFLLNQRVGKLTFFDNTVINNVYLMFVLSQKHIRQQLVKSAGGSTQINVGKPAVLGVEFFVPPMKLQEQFAAFVEQTDKSKFEIQKSLEKLETLKKALMQKYFG